MSNFILDFETLGTNVFSCVAVNCAVLKFHYSKFTSETPYTFDELLSNTRLFKLSVEDQIKNYKYKIEASSLDFWKSLPTDVRSQINPSKTDLPITEFMRQLLDFIGNTPIHYWWSRQNTFDPIILYRIAHDTNCIEELHQKLKYWRVRDTRTFIDAKTNGGIENTFPPMDEETWKLKFKEHDCRHDVAADVLRLQALIRIENGLST